MNPDNLSPEEMPADVSTEEITAGMQDEAPAVIPDADPLPEEVTPPPKRRGRPPKAVAADSTPPIVAPPDDAPPDDAPPAWDAPRMPKRTLMEMEAGRRALQGRRG